MLGVVVVVGTIEVGGHDGDIIGAVLAVEELAVLEAADLGQRIGFVGLLQRTGEQAALWHGLGSHAGVDTAAAQKLEFLAAVLPGGMDDVHLEDHILVHEVGQCALVSHDAAHLGGSKEHVLGLLLSEEGLYGILTGEVKFRVGSQHQVVISLAFQFPYYCTTDHASVTGYIYLTCFFHLILDLDSSLRSE